jgi:transposase InsO family protein
VGSFFTIAFRIECEQARIIRQFTPPYTPQQNGIVERKNMIVMEITRALVKSMSIPARY